jgi:hypothetical protein
MPSKSLLHFLPDPRFCLLSLAYCGEKRGGQMSIAWMSGEATNSQAIHHTHTHTLKVTSTTTAECCLYAAWPASRAGMRAPERIVRLCDPTKPRRLSRSPVNIDCSLSGNAFCPRLMSATSAGARRTAFACPGELLRGSAPRLRNRWLGAICDIRCARVPVGTPHELTAGKAPYVNEQWMRGVWPSG